MKQKDACWAAWTERHLLDQWWAPKPWKARIKTMDFKSIVPFKKYTGLDAFCDENGNVDETFPKPFWTVEFSESGNTTLVRIEVKFAELADLEKYVEMGFREGFIAAMENLDRLVAAKL